MASQNIVPFQRWKWTSPTFKMLGVSLGNWLVLERWMQEDWMVEYGGQTAVDEWTFSQNLGKENASAVLSQHWQTWITNNDIQTIAQSGFNHVRIVGFHNFTCFK